MKRNLDLLRDILVALEAHATPSEWIDPEVDGHTGVEVSYHIMLLHEAGLLEGWDRSAIGVFRWSASRLTWEGHEFLEAARDDATWKEITERVAERTGGQPFVVVKDALLASAKEKLGIAP